MKSSAQMAADQHAKPMLFAAFEKQWPEIEVVPAGTRKALAEALAVKAA